MFAVFCEETTCLEFQWFNTQPPSTWRCPQHAIMVKERICCSVCGCLNQVLVVAGFNSSESTEWRKQTAYCNIHQNPISGADTDRVNVDENSTRISPPPLPTQDPTRPASGWRCCVYGCKKIGVYALRPDLQVDGRQGMVCNGHRRHSGLGQRAGWGQQTLGPILAPIVEESATEQPAPHGE